MYPDAGKNDRGQDLSFVITGDIYAMWLRDSTNQMLPYIDFAKSDEALNSLFQGVIRKQIDGVLLDPYANAFNRDHSGDGANDRRTPNMQPGLHEGKYELDSLAAVIKLSCRYCTLPYTHTLSSSL